MEIVIALAALLAYVLLCVGVHFYSYRPLYRPDASSYEEDSFADLIQMKGPQGNKIMGRWLHNPDSKWVVLFSHGNRSDLGNLSDCLEEIRREGYSVFSYDYPGYGKSEGRPTERGLYEAAETAYRTLTEELSIPSAQILLWGRSLGGGPSAQLARARPVGGVILESTFVSVYRSKIRVPLLLGDKYHNLKKMKKSFVPTLIIHGTEDDLIPIWHGKKLYQNSAGPKQCYWVEGAGHYDFQSNNPDYWNRLREFSVWLDELSLKS